MGLPTPRKKLGEGWLKQKKKKCMWAHWKMVSKALRKNFERIKEKERSHKVRVYKAFIHKSSDKLYL